MSAQVSSPDSIDTSCKFLQVSVFSISSKPSNAAPDKPLACILSLSALLSPLLIQESLIDSLSPLKARPQVLSATLFQALPTPALTPCHVL